jgi:hypothetical protein
MPHSLGSDDWWVATTPANIGQWRYNNVHSIQYPCLHSNETEMERISLKKCGSSSTISRLLFTVRPHIEASKVELLEVKHDQEQNEKLHDKVRALFVVSNDRIHFYSPQTAGGKGQSLSYNQGDLRVCGPLH